LQLELIDSFFLLSFLVWIILGYLIFRRFYTSIEEILSTTEFGDLVSEIIEKE
jgi:hypothetical protein